MNAALIKNVNERTLRSIASMNAIASGTFPVIHARRALRDWHSALRVDAEAQRSVPARVVDRERGAAVCVEPDRAAVVAAVAGRWAGRGEHQSRPGHGRGAALAFAR